MAARSGFQSKQFDRSILTLGRAARLRAEQSIKQANRLLAARVWKECPVDTGQLRDSIRIEPIRVGPLGVSQEVTVGRTDPRQIVGFVHDGTRRQKPNPFFDRAVAATEGQRDGLVRRTMANLARYRAK